MFPRSPTALDPAIERELGALDAALRGDDADSELAELVALVGEQRPSPRADFVARLDARAAAGFAASDAPERARGRAGGWIRRQRTMLAIAGAVAPVLIAAAIVAPGLLGGSGSSRALQTSEPTGVSVVQGPPASSGPIPGAALPSRGPHQAGAPASLPPGGPLSAGAPASPLPSGPLIPARRVQQAISLTLATPPSKLSDTADGVVSVTDSFGGIVQSSTVDTTDGAQGNAYFDLRIPVARLQPALAALSGLAHVSARSEQTVDATEVYNSADNAVQDARAERASLLRSLASASGATAARYSAQLGAVELRLRSDESVLSGLAALTNYAGVAVTINADSSAGGAPGDGSGGLSIGSAAHDAGLILITALGVLVVGLAALVPLALAGLALGLGARVVRRHRRERVLATSI